MPATEPERAQVLEALERILASPPFVRSTRLARFLRFVVEARLSGRTVSPKEYELGVQVFERSPDYDPRVDPIIRVQARQLRFKLREYYASDGAGERIRIELPKGSYLPTFNCEAEAVGHAEALAAGPEPRVRPRRSWIWVWLAAAVALGLSVGLWIHAHARAATRTIDPAARDFYLQGRYHWNQRTAESLHQAVDDFTHAIARDGGYAQAYAGLADCYNLLPEFSVMAAGEAFPRAIVAARKAVALDDSLAGAHASLAFASFYGALDSRTADREFRRAIELDKANAQAHHWYATALMTMGRFGAALGEIEQARELQPDSHSILADKGLILWYLKRTSEAKALLQQIETAKPSFISPHRYLSSLYLASKDYKNYLAEMRQWMELSHDEAQRRVVAAGEKGLAAGGGRGMLEAMLEAQKRLYPEGSAQPYDLALTCALLGRREEAIGYLNVVFEKRDFMILISRIDLALASLRETPQYRELLARAGL